MWETPLPRSTLDELGINRDRRGLPRSGSRLEMLEGEIRRGRIRITEIHLGGLPTVTDDEADRLCARLGKSAGLESALHRRLKLYLGTLIGAMTGFRPRFEHVLSSGRSLRLDVASPLSACPAIGGEAGTTDEVSILSALGLGFQHVIVLPFQPLGTDSLTGFCFSRYDVALPDLPCAQRLQQAWTTLTEPWHEQAA